MSGVLGVNTDITRATARRLQDAEARLSNAVSRLEGQLQAIGPCWGSSDEVADAFRQNYVPARDNVVKGGNDIAQVLGQVADRVGMAMDGYDEAETAAVRSSAPSG